jgi:hypothetical protein
MEQMNTIEKGHLIAVLTEYYQVYEDDDGLTYPLSGRKGFSPFSSAISYYLVSVE